MWRFLFAVAVIVAVAEAQRSSYAPRPGSNSKLLPRFKNNQSSSSSSTSTSSTERTLDTRGGDVEDETGTPLPEDLQGTLEDERFVHRVSKWPQDRQPFWFKNRHAISSMRGRETDGGYSSQPSNRNFASPDPVPRFQSPFFGPSNVRSRNSQNVARFQPNDGFYPQDDLISGYNPGPFFYGRHYH